MTSHYCIIFSFGPLELREQFPVSLDEVIYISMIYSSIGCVIKFVSIRFLSAALGTTLVRPSAGLCLIRINSMFHIVRPLYASPSIVK